MKPAYFLTISEPSEQKRAELFELCAELFGFSVLSDYYESAEGCFLSNYTKSAEELADMRDKLPQLAAALPQASIVWSE